MNWDISIGHSRQVYGRLLQAFGRRTRRLSLILDGERIEFTGRLQSRYGLLKHQVQWNSGLVRIPLERSAVEATAERMRSRKRSHD